MVMKWINLAASAGSNPVGIKVRVTRMGGVKAPAIMQAMPSRCLLMLTVISFPPGLRRMRLGQFCPSGSRLGFGAGGWNWEGHWGRDTGFFPPGLTVLLHLRASTGGFRCALPEGLEAW